VNLLFDSHALLWLMFRPDRLDPAARRQLDGRPGAMAFSIVSIWELQIKLATGKMDIDMPNWAMLRDTGALEILSVTVEDAVAAAALPPHHRDPFDRMIIAQAARRGLTIVSRDRVFEAYRAPMLMC
jgi:PIN domain nuclease of toxin-antitoxin system